MSTKEYANSSKYQKSPQFVFHWFPRCQFPLGLHVIQLESFKHPFWLVGWLVGWCVGWLVGWLILEGCYITLYVLGIIIIHGCESNWPTAKCCSWEPPILQISSLNWNHPKCYDRWSLPWLESQWFWSFFQQLPPEFPRSVHRWMDFLIDCGSMFHLRALVYPIKSP